MFEGVEAALDGVASAVDVTVEAGRPAAAAAPVVPVPFLVGFLRDGVADAASSQVGAESARAVCLMGSEGRWELTFRARADPLCRPGPQSPVDKTRLARAQQHGPQVGKNRYRSVSDGIHVVPFVQASPYLTAPRFAVRSPSRLCGSPLTSA